MDEFREREHLAQAERHIAETKTHIARQKETIAELKRDGHETKVAMLMLNALKHALCAFEKHRGSGTARATCHVRHGIRDITELRSAKDV
jgi:hypothetical protein